LRPIPNDSSTLCANADAAASVGVGGVWVICKHSSMQ